MRLLVISLSTDCIKQPRCTFCYQKEWGSIPYDNYKLYNTVSTILEKHKGINTICFEYNGYNLGWISGNHHILEGKHKTMTTMPEAITPVLCGMLKSMGIEAVSLSYDKEKCTTNQWIYKAKMIKEAGIKVTCNFLITYDMVVNGLVIPKAILSTTDQLNLLIEKPSGSIDKGNRLNAVIEELKSMVPVAVDNCLGVQLGLIDGCKAGKDFLHILPNGSVMPCSFTSMCHLWVDKK